MTLERDLEKFNDRAENIVICSICNEELDLRSDQESEHSKENRVHLVCLGAYQCFKHGENPEDDKERRLIKKIFGETEQDKIDHKKEVSIYKKIIREGITFTEKPCRMKEE